MKFVRIVFVSSSDYSLTTLHVIAESFIILAKFFSIFAITCRRIPNIIFSHAWRFSHSHQHLLLFHHWYKLHFFPWNLHLHSDDRCFVNIFDSFVPVIMLNTLRINSYVLFGSHTLLGMPLRKFKLPTHLPNLTKH